jgi:cytochrome bd-type quinol oxidase subunit 2
MLPDYFIQLLSLGGVAKGTLWVSPLVLLCIWLAIFTKEDLAKRIMKFLSVGMLIFISIMFLFTFLVSLKDKTINDNWYEKLKNESNQNQ